MVFNYTSPLEGEDLSWQRAQGGPTWVYWVVLDLSKAHEVEDYELANTRWVDRVLQERRDTEERS